MLFCSGQHWPHQTPWSEWLDCLNHVPWLATGTVLQYETQKADHSVKAQQPLREHMCTDRERSHEHDPHFATNKDFGILQRGQCCCMIPETWPLRGSRPYAQGNSPSQTYIGSTAPHPSLPELLPKSQPEIANVCAAAQLSSLLHLGLL